MHEVWSLGRKIRRVTWRHPYDEYMRCEPGSHAFTDTDALADDWEIAELAPHEKDQDD